MSLNPLTTILNAKKDLDTVYEKVFDAKKEWEKIGLGLKLNPDTLGAIGEECPSNSDKALLKMLKVWFDTKEPTWEKLCKCLCKNTVSRNVLAAEIHDYVIEKGNNLMYGSLLAIFLFIYCPIVHYCVHLKYTLWSH